MSFITPYLCDRRVYDKKGKWVNHTTKHEENIFYFVKEPLTLKPTYRNGREELAESITITIFGGKPFAKEDTITLYDGTEWKITDFTERYIEDSIYLKDMLKQRIESTDLVLM